MVKTFLKWILDPYLINTMIKSLICKLEFGSYENRVKIGAVKRPQYGYCIYNAAAEAKRLGYQQISVLEFGVAGGNGLINLEYHAQKVAQLFSLDIDIYGFDAAEGLPEPLDYRDLPYVWKKGSYKMDVAKLQGRLKTAKLVLGDIRETSKDFFEKYNPSPIGAIMYDFDYYSSTFIALNMLDNDEKYYLPRVFCYFDDTFGSEIDLLNDYTGERLAINEFNEVHKDKKLCMPYLLRKSLITDTWLQQIWICHFFQHSLYNYFINEDNQQLPLI